MKKITYLIVILIILTVCFIIMINLTPKNDKFEISFKNRIDSLEKYDTGIDKYGWLQVQGTGIDVPIVSPLFIGDLDIDYGWIVSSSLGHKTHKVIVGHNVINVSSDPMVDSSLSNFENLMAFSYYDFAKNNLYLKYTSGSNEYIYAIYAIGFYDYGSDNSDGFDDEKEIKEYIYSAKKNSIYKYNIDVNENDDIITIKTCTRYFGINEKQQFIIDARRLRDGEQIKKYKVSKTKFFDDLKLKTHYNEKNNSF